MDLGNEIIDELRNDSHARAYFMLIKSAGIIEAIMKSALKPYQLTHSQLSILGILFSKHPKSMSSNELKAKIIAASPDMTRLIDKLIDKGWVSREICPSNRRQLDIRLTDKGMKHYIKAHYAAKSAVRGYFKNEISETEAQELFRILKMLKL